MTYRQGYKEIENPRYIEYPNYGPGKCRVCGQPVQGRQRFYCGWDCQQKWHWHGRKLIKLFWSELRDRLVREAGVCSNPGCKKNMELEAHHIIPLYLGGDQWDEKNIKILCRECHDDAHRRLPKYIPVPIEKFIQLTLDTVSIVNEVGNP